MKICKYCESTNICWDCGSCQNCQKKDVDIEKDEYYKLTKEERENFK